MNMNPFEDESKIQIAPIGSEKPDNEVKNEIKFVKKAKKGRPKGKKDSIKRKGLDYFTDKVVAELDKKLDKFKDEIKEFVSTPAMNQIASDKFETGTDFKIPPVEQLLNSRSESENFRELSEQIRQIHMAMSSSKPSAGLRWA